MNKIKQIISIFLITKSISNNITILKINILCNSNYRQTQREYKVPLIFRKLKLSIAILKSFDNNNLWKIMHKY